MAERQLVIYQPVRVARIWSRPKNAVVQIDPMRHFYISWLLEKLPPEKNIQLEAQKKAEEQQAAMRGIRDQDLCSLKRKLGKGKHKLKKL